VTKVSLDTNLTLLLVVGRAERGLISKHKRLNNFSDADYELLVGQLAQASALVTTPNSLTEASNLAPFGVLGPSRGRVMQSLRALAQDCQEVYRPSREVSLRPEFERLGLADCVWLSIVDTDTVLLTVDNELYLAALDQGTRAINFDHVRAARLA
jgi:hypothetical protein